MTWSKSDKGEKFSRMYPPTHQFQISQFLVRLFKLIENKVCLANKALVRNSLCSFFDMIII
jgi:hypothetical protein